MGFSPLVSVIVPVYNIEKLLNKCISSITNQTYKNLEIILIDDGSFDNSSKMCDEWSENDDRIKVIHKVNEGQGVARNKGMDISTGEYIMFVDSDDYIELTMIEKLVKATNGGAHDVALCGIIYDFGKRLVNAEWYSEDKVLDNQTLMLEYISAPHYIGAGPVCKLFRREKIAGLEFPNFRCVEDTYIMPHFLSRCSSAAVIKDSLYYYLQRMGSTDYSGFSEERLVFISCQESLMNLIKDKYPQYFPIVADRKLKTIYRFIAQIYRERKHLKFKNTIKRLQEQLFDELNKASEEIKSDTEVLSMERYLKCPCAMHFRWIAFGIFTDFKILIKRLISF